MTADLRESPAGHLREACAAASAAGAVTLREIPFLVQTEVRARDDATAARVLGDLPGPGRTRSDGGPHGPGRAPGERTVLWCGPGWYLVVAGAAATPPVEPAQRPEGAGAVPGVSVVDTSAARTTLELRGPCARDVLGHGCRIDLHPRVFGPGSAARTNVARTNVVLHQVDAEPAYGLYVGASYADYLTRWLLDAMAPYVGPPPAGGRRGSR